MALPLEKEINDNEGSFYKKSSAEVWIQRGIRQKAEWQWLCRFYKIAIANVIRAQKEEQEEREQFLKSLKRNRDKQHSPKPAQAESVYSPTVNPESSRPRTWSDGDIKYTPGKTSPIDTFCKAKSIHGPKYVRVVQNGNNGEGQEERYELSPYETPVWPQQVLIIYDESRYKSCVIRSAKEIPANAQRIEIRETELQQFARAITHPSTLTFKLVYHTFGKGQIGEWFSSEGADETIILALDRLVRITHHPRYELGFVFEDKFSKPRYYRIVKQQPKSSEDAEEEAEEKTCPTDEDLQVLEKEETEKQESKETAPEHDKFSPPVLTEESQKHIEKFAKRGLAFDTMFKNLMFEHRILTREEETDLAIRMRNGDTAAKNELIQVNLKLVVSILRHRFSVFQNHPNFWDMFTEGVLGVMRAAETFDPQRGYKFSTYATWWVKQTVTRAITDRYFRGPMRLPVHMAEAVYLLRKTVRKFFSEHQRKPTFQEIANLMEISEKRVENILRATTLQLPPKSASSLSANVEDEDLDSVLDMIIYQGGAIADSREVLDKRISEEQNIDFILDAIDRIPSVFHAFGDAGKIRYILTRYFSVIAVGDNPAVERATLEDMGAEFGVTRERVRQWLKDILGALRKFLKPGQLGLDIDKRMIRLEDTRPRGFIGH